MTRYTERSTLYGGDGNDQLDGDSGDDVISGDNGQDFVFGDAGYDHCLGGNDKDSHVLWMGGATKNSVESSINLP